MLFKILRRRNNLNHCNQTNEKVQFSKNQMSACAACKKLMIMKDSLQNISYGAVCPATFQPDMDFGVYDLLKLTVSQLCYCVCAKDVLRDDCYSLHKWLNQQEASASSLHLSDFLFQLGKLISSCITSQVVFVSHFAFVGWQSRQG